MTDHRSGWYFVRRAGQHAAVGAGHFVAALHDHLDSTGRHLAIADVPSACGRIPAGAIVWFDSAEALPSSCRSCRKALAAR